MSGAEETGWFLGLDCRRAITKAILLWRHDVNQRFSLWFNIVFLKGLHWKRCLLDESTCYPKPILYIQTPFSIDGAFLVVPAANFIGTSAPRHPRPCPHTIRDAAFELSTDKTPDGPFSLLWKTQHPCFPLRNWNLDLCDHRTVFFFASVRDDECF